MIIATFLEISREKDRQVCKKAIEKLIKLVDKADEVKNLLFSKKEDKNLVGKFSKITIPRVDFNKIEEYFT